MNTRLCLTSSLSLLLIILIYPASIPIQAQGKPVLYGKVLLQTSSGFKKPLLKAKIELLEVVLAKKQKKPGEVLFKTYTSNKGDFTFFKIPVGKYYLRVSLGKKVFFQLQNNIKVEVSSVTVSNPNTTKTLPPIIALQK